MSTRPLAVIRAAPLVGCIAWKLIESLHALELEALVMVGLLGALPYLALAALAALASWMRPGVTVVATLTALVVDVAARADAASSSSSTASVALLVAPITSAVVVVPSAALLSWLLHRGKAAPRTLSSSRVPSSRL